MVEADQVRDQLGAVADPVILFETLLAEAPVASVIADLAGRCIAANRSYRALFGAPESSLWRGLVADDVPASHSERFAAACRRAGVPVVFTEFPRGPHGLGMALDYPGDLGAWTTKLLLSISGIKPS